VQGDDSGDDWSERGGNLRVLRVGDVHLAGNFITVNLGMEGVRNLASRTGEEDAAATGSDGLDGKSMALEPSRDLCEVGWRCAEAASILRGREPLVVIGGARLLLRFGEGVEGLLLACIGLQQKDHSIEASVVGDSTPIEFGPGQRMGVSGESHNIGIHNGTHDAAALACSRDLRESA
jgi:hypothetical protein